MLSIVQQAAKEYKWGLQQLYGDELVELILFGSYARGTQHEESDLDFALVPRSSTRRSLEVIQKAAIIGSRLSLKYAIVVSTFPTSINKSKLQCKAFSRIFARRA